LGKNSRKKQQKKQKKQNSITAVFGEPVFFNNKVD
jgi:hypothetical protein